MRTGGTPPSPVGGEIPHAPSLSPTPPGGSDACCLSEGAHPAACALSSHSRALVYHPGCGCGRRSGRAGARGCETQWSIHDPRAPARHTHLALTRRSLSPAQSSAYTLLKCPWSARRFLGAGPRGRLGVGKDESDPFESSPFRASIALLSRSTSERAAAMRSRSAASAMGAPAARGDAASCAWPTRAACGGACW